MVADAVPRFVVSLMDWLPLLGWAGGRFFSSFCALWRSLRELGRRGRWVLMNDRRCAPRGLVACCFRPFGGLRLAACLLLFCALWRGLGALRCFGLAAGFSLFCALLRGLGAFVCLGFAAGFLLGCLLACGCSGGWCRADVGDQVLALAMFNLITDGGGALEGCVLRAVAVLAAEVDFAAVGRGGFPFGVPAGLA